MRQKERSRRVRLPRKRRFESLEPREMLAGDAIKVNFQVGTAIDEARYPELQGYVADDGSAYGNRGNGMTYGWLSGDLTPDTQAETRDRNSAAAPDERYDTLNHMIKGDNHHWQIDLPNGSYELFLAAGDPSHTDQISDLELISGANRLMLTDPDGQDNWDLYSVEEFTVTDGRLLVAPAPSGSNQKLAFIEITLRAAPEPPEIENGAVTNLSSTSATVSGIVTLTGNEDPTVTLFLGTNDGGTNAAAWTRSIDLGQQSGAFATAIADLTPDTTYYYRARAVNSAGTAWSSASDSFTTVAVMLPSVMLTGATDVEALASTMQGQVSDDGNDPPQVHFFWGTVDGGTDPTAWQAQADVGQQSSAFSWTVGDLQPGTEYFYRARAENRAGTVWTSPATFTTQQAFPAQVVNDPPREVTSSTARLGGQVLDTGNHAPRVRLYYGPTDGQTNPAAWQAFVEFPEEYGSFETTVTGLTGDTQYYFRTQATNVAGDTWASASGSFRTLETPTLLITEFVASNQTTLTTRLRSTPGGSLGATIMPDWIELYNPSDQAISLAGLHLTDDATDRTKWTFPAEAQIDPHGYLVVFASGEDITDGRLDQRGFYHTNFRLSAEGEFLAVTAADGSILHAFDPGFPQQRTDISYGIDAAGQARYYATATPGANNTGGEINFVKDTSFSVDRGFFAEPFPVEIRTKTPGATIVYTVDGSPPTLTNGTIVPAASEEVLPVAQLTVSHTTTLRAAAFKSGFEPTNIDTQTYLFLGDVLQQSESYGKDGSGLPTFTAWGHSGKNGDWEVDPEIVHHALAENRLTADDLRAVPTLSLVLPWEDMFIAGSGIYISGTGSPRAVSVEQILPDGSTGFQINGSVQIQGGSSTGRWKADKLSMRLKFTEEYGPTKLVSSMFGADATRQLDTIVLDAVLNYGFHHPSTSQTDYAKFIQDQFVANLQNKMGGYAPHARYHHLYINGLYWGMYYVHERPDASFAAEYLGGNKEDYDVLKHNASTAVDGTTANYQQMLRLARKNLADPANYEDLAQVLDLEDFVDYMLVNFYAGNTDWAHQNWYASYNRVDPDGRWRFHSWDAEHVLKSVSEDVTGKDNSGGPTEIHQNLLANAEYRLMFADHVERHLFHDGALTPENAAAEYQKLIDEIDRAVVGETARWGDNRVSSPYTHADWLRTQTNLLTRYFPTRTSRVLSQLQADGLYPATTISTPTFAINGTEMHGGHAALGDALTLAAGSGTIYYTSDGSDPRLPGGDLSPAAHPYSQPLVVDGPLQLKARLRTSSGDWSALSEAAFYVHEAATAGTLAITEINYNPHESLAQFGEAVIDSDEFEFLELMNVGTQPIELANVQFVQTVAGNDLEGISFVFPQQTLLPGQRTVVVANQSAFVTRYTTLDGVAGEYSGRLNDGGELITLLDASGEVIQQFTFGDSGGWPGRADAGGSTLEILDVAGDYALSSNWRSSSEFGGTPTTAGLGPVQDIVFNEILTHTDLPLVDQVELYNRTDQPIDIANWYLSDNRDQLLASPIPTGDTVIPAQGYLVLDETALGFGFHGQEADDAWLLAADGTGKPLRFVDHIEFGATQNGVSLGRWPDGSGDLFPMTARTFGSANSGPLPPAVVLSELHYHPAPPVPAGELAQEDLEFVELWNPTSEAVALSHWRLNRAIDFAFAAGTELAAGEAALVVSFDPRAEPGKALAFRTQFGLSAELALYGPYKGVLDNGGENLELDRPEDPLQLGLGYVLVDRVRYDDAAPWPISADGQGDSLQRSTADAYGNLSTSWTAATPTPGQTPSVQLPGDLNGDGQVDAADINALAAYIQTGNPLGDLNGDQVTDPQDRDALVTGILGTSSGDSNLDRRFDTADLVLVLQRGEYEDGIAHNSTWESGDWNGDGEFDTRDIVDALQTGRYEQPARVVDANRLAAAIDWIFAEPQSQTKRTRRAFFA